MLMTKISFIPTVQALMSDGAGLVATVDGKRFVGLNIHGFSAIKVFMEILSYCLGHKCSLFSTIKERHLYSRKNFHGTPENREKHESLAQRIFPRLQYVEKKTLVYHVLSFISAVWFQLKLVA